jgi:hypothetical protein
MVLKLESLSQRQAGHDVVVVGSGRTNSRQAMRAPVFVSSERLAAADTDRFNPAGYPVNGITRGGLRAGRSVGSGGSLPSRRLAARPWCHGLTGRTHRTAKRQGSMGRPVM